MSESSVVAIARIPRARSPRRLLAAPLLLLLIAVGVVVTGLLVLPDWRGWALIIASLLPMAAAVYLVLVVLTVRLDVEVSQLHLRWIGVDRRYSLVRGPVTRAPLVGDRRVKLRPRLGAFSWGIGRARLRGEETVELVRLARTPAVILVPTDGGRVAVAPRSEEQFLEALAAAARVQQRLDQVAARAREIPVARIREEVPAPEPVLQLEGPPRTLTGIERTLLEERLAAERAAALAAAEEERLAAERAAAMRAQRSAPAGARPETSRPSAVARSRVPRPSLPAISVPRPRLSLPATPTARLISLGLAVVPLVVAVSLWIALLVAGTSTVAAARPEQFSIGLALGGPAAALAALAARAWFPRLVGLVIVTSLCALVLVGRALLG